MPGMKCRYVEPKNSRVSQIQKVSETAADKHSIMPHGTKVRCSPEPRNQTYLFSASNFFMYSTRAFTPSTGMAL